MHVLYVHACSVNGRMALKSDNAGVCVYVHLNYRAQSSFSHIMECSCVDDSVPTKMPQVSAFFPSECMLVFCLCWQLDVSFSLNHFMYQHTHDLYSLRKDLITL